MHREAPLLGRCEQPSSFFGPTLPGLARRMMCWKFALFSSAFSRLRRLLRLMFSLSTSSLSATALWVSRIRSKALKILLYTSTGWGNPRYN